MDNQSLGKYGEDAATKLVEEKGYIILERNYRALGTEIDIIAMNRGILVFIEVKTRTSRKYGNAYEAVNSFKMKNIINTSLSYIMKNNLESSQVRYDIIEVYVNENLINHIENAFELN